MVWECGIHGIGLLVMLSLQLYLFLRNVTFSLNQFAYLTEKEFKDLILLSPSSSQLPPFTPHPSRIVQPSPSHILSLPGGISIDTICHDFIAKTMLCLHLFIIRLYIYLDSTIPLLVSYIHVCTLYAIGNT